VNEIRKLSEFLTIVSFVRTAGIVFQSRSRTATSTRRRISWPP